MAGKRTKTCMLLNKDSAETNTDRHICGTETRDQNKCMQTDTNTTFHGLMRREGRKATMGCGCCNALKTSPYSRR